MSGIDGDSGAPDVVTVQTIAGIAVEFGLNPGPQHDRALWTRHRSLRITGILQRVAQHASANGIFADTEGGSQPVCPACGSVGPNPDSAFLHMIVAHSRKPIALLGLEQSDLNVIDSALKPDAGLRLQPRKSPVNGVTCVEASDGTAIKLIELITIDRVVEKIGEIVVELQVRANDVGGDVGLAELA